MPNSLDQGVPKSLDQGVSNSFDPDQARHAVGPYLGSNVLQRLSADGTRRQIVKHYQSFSKQGPDVSSKTVTRVCNNGF